MKLRTVALLPPTVAVTKASVVAAAPIAVMVAEPKSAAVVDEENDQCVVSAVGAGKVPAWLGLGMKPNRIDARMVMEKEQVFMDIGM